MIEHATGQTLVRMELKYCEGCGGLLLRRAGDMIVYCAGCQARLADLAQSTPAMTAPCVTTYPAPGNAANANPCSAAGPAAVVRTARPHPPVSPSVAESCNGAAHESASISVPKLPPQPAVSANHADSRRMA